MKTKNLIALVLMFYLWPTACLGAYWLAVRSMESGSDALALIPIVGIFEVMGFVAFAVVVRGLKRAESGHADQQENGNVNGEDQRCALQRNRRPTTPSACRRMRPGFWGGH